MNQQSSLMAAEPREWATVMARARRHFRPSLAIVLACLALAALAAVLWPRSYTASASLSYDPQLPLTRGGGGVAMTDAQRDAAIDAQLAAVTDWAVAQDVARSVDLAANPRLQRDADRWAAGSERQPSRDEALGRALLDHVKARRVGQTPVFTISFTTDSAAQAALIANDFASSYLKAAVRQKIALAGSSAAQLATQVAALRGAANAAAARLAAFRLAHHLVETPDSIAQDQEVSALRGQLAEANGQAAATGTRSALAAGATIVGGGSGGSVDTTAVSALTEQRAGAAADLAALLGRYGEKHPDVIAAREKLAELDAQLAAAMHGNRDSAAVEARASDARARALSASLADARSRRAASVGDDARRLDLENTALAARLAYQDALKLSADQIAERALIQPDAQVIAAATAPLRAASPRIAIIMLAGLVFGLGAAVATAIIRESWVHTLGSPDDIARWLETDYFAPLPRLAAALKKPGTRDPIEAVLLHPQSAFAGSFASLGAAALAMARVRDSAGGRVIGVISALPGEGKTTVSIGMGRMLAAAGRTVAVVNGDPRGGPQIRVLAGEATPGGAPSTDQGGLALFADGLAPDAAAMIAALRRDYDVVIIDCAAVLERDAKKWAPVFRLKSRENKDSRALLCDSFLAHNALAGGANREVLAGIDALVLLARWRATPVRAVRDALRRIAAAGGHVGGVALTMSAEA